jgi:Flp pilus assembly protein TadB
MADLGHELGIQELEELTSGVRLADTQGASISESLTARARSMRLRRLAEAERAAGRKSEQMSLAVAIFALGLLIFVLFPIGQRLISDTDFGVSVPNASEQTTR